MAAQIDKATGLLYEIKRPAPESRIYSIDFKKLLSSIQSVTSVIPQPRGLVSDTDTLVVSEIAFSGTQVFFRLSNGTDKEDYEIQAIVVDTSGNIIKDDILIKVRIAGLV